MSRLLRAVIILLILAAMVPAISAQDNTPPLKVAMLIPGQIDDGGFMEAGYDGLMAIKEDLNANVRYIDQVRPTEEELTTALRLLALGEPDLIIAHGGQNSQAAAEVAPEFPDVKFVVVQGNVTGDNLSSYEVLQEQSTWLAGAAAGLLTKTNVVGHISGIRVGAGLKGRAAFYDGLMTTNPDATFLTTFSGDQDDVDLNRAVAEAQIAAGADIIFTMLNAGRVGVIDACREAGIWQIGNVRDWYPDYPDVFVASAIANVGIAELRAAQDVANGTWEPGVIVKIGIEDPNAVSLALAPNLPEDVLAELDALTAKLTAGEIQYSTEYNGEEFDPGM